MATSSKPKPTRASPQPKRGDETWLARMRRVRAQKRQRELFDDATKLQSDATTHDLREQVSEVETTKNVAHA